jgi:glucosylceramidase
VASPLHGRFHLVIDDGAVVTASHDVHTGGWQTWSTIEIRDLQLRAGPQTLQIVTDIGGLNFNYIEWIRQGPVAPRSAYVHLTTADGTDRLAPQPPVSFGPLVANPFTITVQPEVRYQEVEGFGASLTDASAWVLAHMDPARRTALMRSLFDPVEGIGLNMLRVPMGASDFALNLYTYDDLPSGHTDFSLSRFSIAHDEAYIIPMLREARAINPSLAIIATPWTAPAWMKTNQSLIGGGHLIDSSAIYATYADYFVRFVRAYENAGIPIFAVTPQNEPLYAADYPSMQLEWWEEYNFIKYHLGPAFEQNGLTTKIIILDHNWSDVGYAVALFRNDPDVLRYVAGTAFHCYAGQPEEMAAVHDAFPRQGIYLTECSAIEGFPFDINLRWFVDTLLVKSMRTWSTSVLRWNLVLDGQNGPRLPSGCETCLGMALVNRSTGAVTFLDDYYAMAHASRFVVRGARRIDSNTFGDDSIQDVAFVNPDGSRVLIVLNAGEVGTRVQVREGDLAFSHDMPSGAVATFVWR